jgi:RES domain-containing protein
MMLYRLAAQEYIEDQTGAGAKLFGGRWNPEGLACLYTSEHVSLAFLEKYVHAKAKENMSRVALLKVEIPENDHLIFHVDANELKAEWYEDVEYSQWLGAQVLRDLSIVAFSVPSVLIPTERNYIVNPLAIDFNQVKFHPATPFSTDLRLLNRLLF